MDRRAFEETLLRNLRSRQPELTALLEECSSHWGFEDPIYRFYHQSFKVYALQDQTSRIVGVLESLAPDRPLNPWFRQIVEQGTGKSFKQDDNADWTRTARFVAGELPRPPRESKPVMRPGMSMRERGGG